MLALTRDAHVFDLLVRRAAVLAALATLRLEAGARPLTLAVPLHHAVVTVVLHHAVATAHAAPVTADVTADVIDAEEVAEYADAVFWRAVELEQPTVAFGGDE